GCGDINAACKSDCDCCGNSVTCDCYFTDCKCRESAIRKQF
uniref:U12-ctenitoxin-Co1a (Fragments) n=1 Tax=Ctenus ornatus TaxID=406443 RepID=TX35E_CTEON|nr:RecName: Full=U12-ctenitoxin-Co1a; Short=U12-CNTX-Co1a; AltName: Full=Neurotoxin Oc M14-5 [Oligoctenus ornatus]